jgi:hypothetical protein
MKEIMFKKGVRASRARPRPARRSLALRWKGAPGAEARPDHPGPAGANQEQRTKIAGQSTRRAAQGGLPEQGEGRGVSG